MDRTGHLQLCAASSGVKSGVSGDSNRHRTSGGKCDACPRWGRILGRGHFLPPMEHCRRHLTGGGEARPRTRNALMLPPRSPTAGHPPDSCLWFVERSGGVEKGVVGRQIWLDSEKEPKSDIELLGELQRRSCRNAVDEPCIPSFMCEF
jgi:hypothetical protein